VRAARQLLAENEQLRTELDRYRNTAAVGRNGFAGDWHQASDHHEQARWCLDRADRGFVRLNAFERKFLTTISRWRGELTERQAQIWVDLLPEIAGRSGRGVATGADRFPNTPLWSVPR
jgi:hypothetical protein